MQSGHEGVEEGMTIGRVMDWIEARQEGLRVAALGEEDEDDERERGAAPKAGPSNNSSHSKNISRESEGRDLARSTQVC